MITFVNKCVRSVTVYYFKNTPIIQVRALSCYMGSDCHCFPDEGTVTVSFRLPVDLLPTCHPRTDVAN